MEDSLVARLRETDGESSTISRMTSCSWDDLATISTATRGAAVEQARVSSRS